MACKPISGGAPVKGLSVASLDGGGGSAPPSVVQPSGGEAANLISVAQLTPLQRVQQENVRRYRLKSQRRPARIHSVEYIDGIVRRGLYNGYLPDPDRPLAGSWDISSDCEMPKVVELYGARTVSLLVNERHPQGRVRTLYLYVRCRRCPACLNKRRNLWAYRAQNEIAHAVRTWMATFTWSPQSHLRMRMAASRRLACAGVDLELLPRLDQIAEISREYRSELTNYFKRLRKQTGAKLRYLLVQEQHKSGLPHFHALIHEDGPIPVRHAALTTQWTLGYSKFNLVEGSKTAWYVAKYLSKSVLNRVRASIGYGKEPSLRHRAAKSSPLPPRPFLGDTSTKEVNQRRNSSNETNCFLGIQPQSTSQASDPSSHFGPSSHDPSVVRGSWSKDQFLAALSASFGLDVWKNHTVSEPKPCSAGKCRPHNSSRSG